MQWQLIVALVVIVPVILVPVLFVWYLNVGGIYAAVKETWARRAVTEKGKKAAVEAKQAVVVDK